MNFLRNNIQQIISFMKLKIIGTIRPLRRLMEKICLKKFIEKKGNSKKQKRK